MGGEIRVDVGLDEARRVLVAAATARASVVVTAPKQGPVEAVFEAILDDGSPVVTTSLAEDALSALDRMTESDLRFTLGDTDFTLVSRLVEVVPGTQKLRFTAAFALFRHQRRQWFRIFPGDACEVRIGERSRQIYDISAGGVCIEYLPKEDDDITPGAELRGLTLCMAGEHVIDVNATVRYTQQVPGDDITRRAGLEVMTLTDFDRDRLFRAVARREREQIARKARPKGAVPAGSLALLSRDAERPRVRRLLDVTTSGARFEFEPQVDADLSVGTRLAAIELRIRGLDSLTLSATVVRVKQEGSDAAVAVEFKDIPLKEREKLSRFARTSSPPGVRHPSGSNFRAVVPPGDKR